MDADLFSLFQSVLPAVKGVPICSAQAYKVGNMLVGSIAVSTALILLGGVYVWRRMFQRPAYVVIGV